MYGRVIVVRCSVFRVPCLPADEVSQTGVFSDRAARNEEQVMKNENLIREDLRSEIRVYPRPINPEKLNAD